MKEEIRKNVLQKQIDEIINKLNNKTFINKVDFNIWYNYFQIYKMVKTTNGISQESLIRFCTILDRTNVINILTDNNRIDFDYAKKFLAIDFLLSKKAKNDCSQHCSLKSK